MSLAQLKAIEEKTKLLDAQILERIWKFIEGDITPNSKQPIALLLGGQPGAGKSSILKNSEIQKELGAFIVINGDTFRAYHPELQKVCALAGDNHPQYTQPFVNRMVEACLKRAIDNKINFVVEGTFRTFEVPNKTIEQATQSGYQVNVAIKTCPRQVSYQRTIQRFENEKKASIIGARPVAQEAHDNVVRVLPENVDRVLKESKVNRLYVFNDTNIIFDSTKNKETPSIEIKRTLYQLDREHLKKNPALLKTLFEQKIETKKTNDKGKEHDR